MNSKGHLIISIVKSALRIAGCLSLIILKDLSALAVLFFVAEILGVLEELVDKR